MRATRRLFFALWPDEEVRVRVADIVRTVAPHGGNNLVPPAQYHITLAFLGEVPIERLDCVLALGDGLSGAPFFLNLDTLGYFPKARVAWLGASVVPPALEDLNHRLANAIPRCGLLPDARPFHPHLTLARKVSRGLDRLATDAIPWRVNEYLLVESRLSSNGSNYRPLQCWPLTADAPAKG